MSMQEGHAAARRLGLSPLAQGVFLVVTSTLIGGAVAQDARLALLAIGGLVVGSLAIARPAETVVGLLVWLPLEGWVAKLLQSSAILAVGDVAAVALLVAFFVRQPLSVASSWRSLAPAVPLVLLGVAGLLSWVGNRTPTIDALYWARVNLRFLPLLLVASSSMWGGRVRGMLVPVALCGVFTQGIIGLAEFFGGLRVAAVFWPTQFTLGAVSTQADTLSSVGDRVVAGTTGHYNIFGALMFLYVGMLSAALLGGNSSETPRQRRLLIAAITLGAICIVLSQSRQSIGLLACLAGLLLARSHGVGRLGRTAGTAAIVVSVALVFLGGFAALASVSERFGALGSASFWTDQFSRDRGYAVNVIASRVLAAAPLLGLGPGSFGTAFGGTTGPVGVEALALDPSLSQFVGDVGWISVYVQVGLVGVLGLAYAVWRMFRLSLTRGKEPLVRTLGLVVGLSLSLGMVASSPIVYKPTSSLIWCLFGAAAGVGVRSDSAAEVADEA
jgi:hypothetical protein